jgi:hypothetical protein
MALERRQNRLPSDSSCLCFLVYIEENPACGKICPRDEVTFVRLLLDVPNAKKLLVLAVSLSLLIMIRVTFLKYCCFDASL